MPSWEGWEYPLPGKCRKSGDRHLLTEVPGLYQRLTPYEYLDFFGQVHRLADKRAGRIEEMLRLVGLWEYDAITESIAWMPFIKKNKDLEKAVACTEEYVRAELGDARSFSLDSPKSRAPRVAFLRKAG